MPSKIHFQVRLPIRVAFAVAMQGIQVRFGRSVVTIMGVMLGIAFLMAILTGQVIKRGVNAEEQLRTETRRLYNFLIAEMGPPRDRVVGLVVIGPLAKQEQRLIAELARQEPAALRLYAVAGAPVPAELPRRVTRVDAAALAATPTALAADASAIIALGDGAAADQPWGQLMAGARFPLLCLTRRSQAFTPPTGTNLVLLERELRPEELEQLAREARRERARNLWIVVISMLVTVIGISNSMLMSVTERFREIGTMKCLGALSHFIRQLFLIESSFVGLVGALLGALLGMLFALVVNAVRYGGPLVFTSLDYGRLGLYFGGAVVIGLLLSIIAALYPAHFASRMLPAHALRSNI